MTEPLHLEPRGNGMHVSRCGRCEVMVRRAGTTGPWNARAYWYGHLVHRLFGRTDEAVLQEMAQWLTGYRCRMLAKVAAFEAWAAQHYGFDLRHHIYPTARRDVLKLLITRTGDGNLALHFDFDDRALTILEAFALVYEGRQPNVPPERRAVGAPETDFAAIAPQRGDR